MEPFKLTHNQYFSINDWETRFPGLIAGFTTKNGGKSTNAFSSLNVGFHVHDSTEKVYENRQILANLLDMPLTNWVGAEQTHYIHIQPITKAEKGKGASRYDQSFKQTDGFFTFDKNILLTLCFADCVPLYFIHPKSKAIAIAHAGWKGTIQGIGREMVQQFNKNGIHATELLVVIGPSICEKCYVVDDNVIDLVRNNLADVEKKPYTFIKEHEYLLDLKELNRQILLHSGVLKENIVKTQFCTSCHQEYFYSHRRDRGNTGRMMSFIGWKEEESV
ncbi:peptidoglycan editing factor PgeF [Bacillus sp. 03113]|uniref:peptidoglycan editing factor PgeF n=1 Tax=Bacillus sp. 03113 TaxID=2578211 RepID=UPI0011444261|nr:peptidoglycan editing factor PgeF [Bacillus sp. 03113]